MGMTKKFGGTIYYLFEKGKYKYQTDKAAKEAKGAGLKVKQSHDTKWRYVWVRN